MQASFKKLDDGNWGICCAADNIPPGTEVDVTKANGDVKRVVVAAYVGATRYGTHLYSITETRPARVYRPRARKSSGEQASLASQTRPYELAEPKQEWPKQANGDLQWATRRFANMYQLRADARADQSSVDTVQQAMGLQPETLRSDLFGGLLGKPSNLSPDSKLFA
jgi:hypothetical protein